MRMVGKDVGDNDVIQVVNTNSKTIMLKYKNKRDSRK